TRLDPTLPSSPWVPGTPMDILRQGSSSNGRAPARGCTAPTWKKRFRSSPTGTEPSSRRRPALKPGELQTCRGSTATAVCHPTYPARRAALAARSVRSVRHAATAASTEPIHVGSPQAVLATRASRSRGERMPFYVVDRIEGTVAVVVGDDGRT